MIIQSTSPLSVIPDRTGLLPQVRSSVADAITTAPIFAAPSNRAAKELTGMAQSQLGAEQSVLSRLLSLFSTTSTAISTARAASQLTGGSLIQNGKLFGNTVEGFLGQLVASNGSAVQVGQNTFNPYGLLALLSGEKNALDTLGQAAQGTIWGGLKSEALDWVSKTFHLDFGSGSLPEIINGLSDKIGIGKIFETSTAIPTTAIAGTTAHTAKSTGTLTQLGGKIIGGLGAAYSAYALVKDWGRMTPVSGAISGAATGAYIGSIVPGIGTLIGGLVGGAVGALGGIFKRSGKGKEQIERDQFRKVLIEAGVSTKDWQVILADGSRFDIGKDGKSTLQNADGSTRRYFELDPSNPLAGYAAHVAAPVTALLSGGNDRLTYSFANYFANAATSNAKTEADVRANLLTMFKRLPIGIEDGALGLGRMMQGNVVDSGEARSLFAGLQSLLS